MSLRVSFQCPLVSFNWIKVDWTTSLAFDIRDYASLNQAVSLIAQIHMLICIIVLAVGVQLLLGCSVFHLASFLAQISKSNDF